MESQRKAEAREAIRDALADLSTSSAVIETQDGNLGLVFFDDGFALIVKLETAGLMVLPEAPTSQPGPEE